MESVAVDTTEGQADQDNAYPGEQTDLLRLFVENVRDYAIFLMDPNGVILHWTPGAERIFGYSESEAVDRLAEIIFTPEDIARGAPKRELDNARSNGRSEDRRWHRRKDGSRFWAEGAMIALTDHTGQISGFGKVLRDATAEERLRFAVQSSDIGTWHWDLVADDLVWSERCKEIFGIPLDAEMDYDRFLAAIHEDDRDRVDMAVMQALSNHADYDAEYRVVWPNGSVHWVNSKGRCHFDSLEKPLRFEGIALDITARKRSDEKVRRLLTQVQARAKREALLNRINMAIRASTDPRGIQAAASAALVEALAVDRCYFVNFELSTGTAYIEQEWYRSGMVSRAGEYRFAEFGIDVERMFRDGRTVAVDDIDQGVFEPAVNASLKQAGIRAGISVPLFEGSRLVAALTVAMSDEPRLWTSDEVALVEAVASQVRSAVEAARITEREHTVAVQLQEALMPVIPEPVNGLDVAHFFKPALDEASVGGDFLDVFQLTDTCVALVIGDVSGKGLAAAAQVATVRNTLRYALYRAETVSSAITNLNQTLTQHSMLAGFVTLFIALYDSESKQMRYVSCGHEPALILRNRNRRVEELLPTGPILGLSPESEYDEKSIRFSDGDSLLMYTDGLSDAGPDRTDLLGVTGLISLLRKCAVGATAKEVATCMVEGASSYARYGFHDDVCVLTAVAQ